MNSQPNLNIATLRAILEEIARMSEQSSLTGMSGTLPRLTSRYNEVVSELAEQGHPASRHFKPLDPATATLGDVMVDSQLLGAALQGDPQRREGASFDHIVAIAPFLSSEDLGNMLISELQNGGDVPRHLLPALAPFLSSSTLSELIRMRPPQTPTAPRAPTEPHASAAPQAPEAPAPFQGEE